MISGDNIRGKKRSLKDKKTGEVLAGLSVLQSIAADNQTTTKEAIIGQSCENEYFINAMI